MDKPKTVTAVYVEKNTDLYVATNGRDDWSGTLPEPNAAGTDGPFASLARARDAVRQLKAEAAGQLPMPVQVQIRGGTYYLEEPLVLGPEDSGTWDCRVRYTAYPGEEPILSGGRKVVGWKTYEDKILQAPLEGATEGKWKFRQLFYNGTAQIRARTPNFDPDNPLLGGWTNMEGPAKPGSQTVFKYKPEIFLRHWAKPDQGEVNVYIGSDWANNIVPIQSVDEENRIVTLARSTRRFVKPFIPFDYPTPFHPNQRFRVENILEELDQPGEWCLDFDEGKLYFWPPDEKLRAPCRKVLESLLVHWTGLTLFVDAPRIPMDNNASERKIRGPALGRKNYYGSGALWSGRLSAMMFSIFATLSDWRINPRRWLLWYLKTCASSDGKAPTDVGPFLPWNLTPDQLASLRAADPRSDLPAA